MNKILSLVKVSLNHDMNIFKINSKKQSKFIKIGLPLIIVSYLMIVIGFYSIELLKMLRPMHLEFAVLTFFSLVIVLFTLIEGIYKSSSLLFNCKDDQLLFSLPVNKETVLFIRILKFYIFELIYNSLFMIPVLVVFAYKLHPGWTYYLSSFSALILLPIVPIILSIIIGFIISFISSKVRGKNIFQTVFTMGLLLLVVYYSYNIDGVIANIAGKASSINDLITRLYYPVGAYISLVNNFKISTLLLYFVFHMLLFGFTIFILSRLYFIINSQSKRVLISKNNNGYKIKKNSKYFAFVKKEVNRFVTTPVFITNAGFGLVLYVIACIMICIKYDSLIKVILKTYPSFNLSLINSYIPVVIFGLICFASLMTSITSSMISLENKSFNILKSLPIRPNKIVLYKVLAAVGIMIPFIIIGDIILFIHFRITIICAFLLLCASFILPFVSELIGILINLKYPKLDATNDTEIVKQSMSSMLSVFIGMGLFGINIYLLYKMITIGMNNILILIINLGIYFVIAILLYYILYKTSDKSFNNITS